METPAKNSKFPQHYQDIYQFYTTKEYEKCLETLEKVNWFCKLYILVYNVTRYISGWGISHWIQNPRSCVLN